MEACIRPFEYSSEERLANLHLDEDCIDCIFATMNDLQIQDIMEEYQLKEWGRECREFEREGLRRPHH